MKEDKRTLVYAAGGIATAFVVGIKTLANSLQFLVKLNTHFLYDSAIPLIGIYPREIKTMPHKDL